MDFRTDTDRTKKRKIWTIVLSLAYFSLAYLHVFHIHKIDGLSYVTVFGIMILVVATPLLWVKPNFTTGKNKLITVTKIIPIAIPLYIAPLFIQKKYKDFHIKNYRTITSGFVNDIGTTKSRGSRSENYYSNVTYNCDGQTKTNVFSMDWNEYKVGDSVLVVYSSKDPDFAEVLSKKRQ